MVKRLSKELLNTLDAAIRVPAYERPAAESAIIHFGIGGFHRSHQAWTFQRLMESNPKLYAPWTICGVCILPQDKKFVDNMKQQDLLYSLRASASGRKEEITVMKILSRLLFGPEDHEEIVERISLETTRVVSFTITEGGYNIDGASGRFLAEHPDIVHDLNPANTPRTVFGYLARGLKKRRDRGCGRLTLMSCDNIQENGDVLKMALGSFLERYDPSLKAYVEANADFPNSMVDRITPVTTEADRKKLEEDHSYRDECLVVCEPFFQWVIEKDKATALPPLETVGVSKVADVRPYERMKLGILNGGHSLAGLLGNAMGYAYIFEAVNETRISALYELYNRYEVIPSLAPLAGVSYPEYAGMVKKRFGNALIRDTSERIISGSTAKIPKFVLPIINQRIAQGENPVIGALILVCWWDYLDRQIAADDGEKIDDPSKEEWLQLFRSHEADTLTAFLNKKDVFGELARQQQFCETVRYYAGLIRKEGVAAACDEAIKYYEQR